MFKHLAKLVTNAVPAKKRELASRCDHPAVAEATVEAFGEQTVTQQSRSQNGKFEYCHACLAQMAIRCAWCSRPIFVGDVLTLMSPVDESFQIPDHAAVFSVEKRQVVGCGRVDCCDTGAEYCGYWVPANERRSDRWIGGVLRFPSLLERAMASGNVEIMNDVTDPKQTKPSGPPIVPERMPLVFTLGIDEAGRGPLAGPVAVGVVAAAEGYDFLAAFPGLNDSKKLSEKRREALYALLREEVKSGNVRAMVCYSSAAVIDKRGISYAVRSALARGVEKLLPNPEEGKIWLDGSLAAPPLYSQETVIGGDRTIPAIMLASIAAKVSRDRLMKKLDVEHPQYGFAIHKGYGTKAHYAALKEYGLSPVHRASFIHLD